jgi:hypothetical protein
MSFCRHGVELTRFRGNADHRNLRTGTSIFAPIQQKSLGKKHLVKNRLISTLDKAIYFKGTILGVHETSPHFTK